MKTLRVSVAVLLAAAAVVPLLTYGAVSIYTLRSGVRRTVVDGNINVARQVGEQVRRYVSTNLQIFRAVAVDMESAGLTAAQQDLILKNFVLRFPEFRELTVYDGAQRQIASSRTGRAFAAPAAAARAMPMGIMMTPVVIDADLLPTTIVTTPIGTGNGRTGWLAGQFSLEELWRMTGRIRIGARGFALVVGSGGELLAHGDPDQGSRVARGENLSAHPVVAALGRSSTASDPVIQETTGADGRPMLSVGVRIAELDWFVLVEQPQAEAFALARRQERELIAAISLALLITVLAGSFWGRTLIRPIEGLIHATQALAAGRLDERVTVAQKGELGRLGSAFNTMADELERLQDNVRRQERHAMFGRVAAGLVHDLSHPFKNVQNNCRLILKMHDDPEYRELFGRTVEREFTTVRRVFEDLRNIAKPMPMERFPLDLNKLVGEVAESMRANAGEAGVAFEVQLGGGDIHVDGDLFALGRVCRNLIVNAIEATSRGTVSVATSTGPGTGRIVVSDTGCGIPPERLETLFDDFTTTKRQGLGLGLAITRKIVDQLGGTIAVESVVGRGTTFTVELPLSEKTNAGGIG